MVRGEGEGAEKEQSPCLIRNGVYTAKLMLSATRSWRVLSKTRLSEACIDSIDETRALACVFP